MDYKSATLLIQSSLKVILAVGDIHGLANTWAELTRSYLETGRGKLISGVGKTLNTMSPGSISNRDPQTIQQPGFQSCSPAAEDQHRLGANEKHLSLLRLHILWPGVPVAQKSCTWRGWFVFRPGPGFSLSLHPQSSCSGATDGESLAGQQSLVLCHPATQLLCFYPKTSNLVFLKAFSDDMCTWHLFAMYICH